MPVPNPNFVASVPLQYVFRDKDTAAPLSAGVVSFFSDPQFTVPKDVYQLSHGVDNQIVFTNLGNVLVLSSIGTFVDNSGDNLIPYYFPWTGDIDDEDPGEPQLYFVTVYSATGVLQFTLQDWPPNCLGGGGTINGQTALSLNQITNPQFSIVSFTPATVGGTYVYNVSGSNTRNPIAPGWELVTTGTGTVTVKQLSLGLDIPSEAPYALQIMSAADTTLSSVQLVQRLTNSPRLLADPSGSGESSAISGYIVAASPVSTSIPLIMNYVPSGVGTTPTLVFSGETTTDGNYSSISDSATIDTPLSTDDASGYVDIAITIPVNTTVSISSVQLVNVDTVDDVPGFIQQSTQQQLNGMMWYYEPQLADKPISNYTIGWDFPLNPCQALGTSVAVSGLGNNTIRYIADQTLAFESVGNSLSYAFNFSGVTATAAVDTQFALVQYLDATTANELLQGNMCVKLNCKTSGTGSIPVGNVTLWYTTNANLPSVPVETNHATFFSTLTAGVPTTIASNWNQIARSGLGAAPFTPTSTSQSFSFSGWNAVSVAGTATYFAIVIGFDTLPSTRTMSIRYASLCKGDIATAPAFLNPPQTLSALEYYYQTSFAPGTPPATNAGGGTYSTQPISGSILQIGPLIAFQEKMRGIPLVTLYNPQANNAQIRNEGTANDYSGTTSGNIATTGFITSGTSDSGSSAGNLVAVNWSADSRLGQV